MKPASKLISQCEAVVAESNVSDNRDDACCYVEASTSVRADAQEGFILFVYAFISRV